MTEATLRSSRLRHRILGDALRLLFLRRVRDVFIISALLVTLFFGGWTAPINWPWPYNLNWLDAAGIGIL